MRVVIEGRELPGLEFVSNGTVLTSVHVGVQVRDQPDQLVRADAPAVRWEVEVKVIDEGIDFRGPAVHGKRGERFLYLTWGHVGEDGTFSMFRRAKVMFGDIDTDVLRAAITSGELVASIGLTDERGGPRCARVRPPAITWRAG